MIVDPREHHLVPEVVIVGFGLTAIDDDGVIGLHGFMVSCLAGFQFQNTCLRNTALFFQGGKGGSGPTMAEQVQRLGWRK